MAPNSRFYVVDGAQQLHVMTVQGGAACTVTDVEAGVEEFRWSPDGKQIAFIKSHLIKGLPPAPPGGSIFTRADFRSIGGDNAISQIWVAGIGPGCVKARPRQLTNAAASAALSFWSNNGDTIFYTTNDTIEPCY